MFAQSGPERSRRIRRRGRRRERGMSDAIWDGVTRAETLNPSVAAARHTLADAAKAYDWSMALALLKQDTQLINTTRPGGQSRYAVLHQAAHGGAPAEVVEQLLSLRAWRTLRTA